MKDAEDCHFNAKEEGWNADFNIWSRYMLAGFDGTSRSEKGNK